MRIAIWVGPFAAGVVARMPTAVTWGSPSAVGAASVKLTTAGRSAAVAAVPGKQFQRQPQARTVRRRQAERIGDTPKRRLDLDAETSSIFGWPKPANVGLEPLAGRGESTRLAPEGGVPANPHGAMTGNRE